jgi:hypothetical protein
MVPRGSLAPLKRSASISPRRRSAAPTISASASERSRARQRNRGCPIEDWKHCRTWEKSPKRANRASERQEIFRRIDRLTPSRREPWGRLADRSMATRIGFEALRRIVLQILGLESSVRTPTTRFSCSARRNSGGNFASISDRTGRDSDDRISQRESTRRVERSYGRLCQRPGGRRLRGRPKPADRISVGGIQIRTVTVAGDRPDR